MQENEGFLESQCKALTDLAGATKDQFAAMRRQLIEMRKQTWLAHNQGNITSIQVESVLHQAEVMIESLSLAGITSKMTLGQLEAVQGQLAAMERQEATMRDTLDQSKAQLRAMERQIRFMALSESAYLSVGDLKIPPIRNNELVVYGKLFNRGKTPAFDFRRQIQIAIGTGGTPPVGWGRFDWSFNPEECESLEIAAGDSVNFATEPLKIDADKLTQINEGKQIIAIDGQCRYRDNVGDLLIYRFGLWIEYGSPQKLDR